MTLRPSATALAFGLMSLVCGVAAIAVSSPAFGLLAGLLGGIACLTSSLRQAPTISVPYQVWEHHAVDTPIPSPQIEGDEPSLIDQASGLMSGRFFRASLDNRVAAARRHLRPVSVILIDVADGRELARQHRTDASVVGDVIRRTLREADIACRLADGRFAFILEDTPENGAVWTVERLRRALIADGSERCLWAGIASYPAHAFTAANVLNRAEVALSAAREWQQDRIEIATTE